MKKQVIFSSVLFLGCFLMMADAPKITIVSPAGGFPLIKNDTQIITWTHSAYFTTHPQDCRIFFGSHVISPPLPVTAGSFTWTIGRKADGTYIPQGIYKLTIESPDYDALNGPTLVLVDEDAVINIITPPNDKDLIQGTPYTITWTHSAYYHVVPQTCTVFCGDHIVSPPIPTLNNSFTWTVGQKKDGTMLPPGRYQITIESDDYDALNGPYINIKKKLIVVQKPLYRKFYFKKIPIHPVPGCPMCFKIDPRELKIDPQSLTGPVTMEILQGTKVLSRLGKFAPGSALPGPVQIKLNKREHLSIKNRQPGYRLRVLSAKGKILQENAIQLVITR